MGGVAVACGCSKDLSTEANFVNYFYLSFQTFRIKQIIVMPKQVMKQTDHLILNKKFLKKTKMLKRVLLILRIKLFLKKLQKIQET